MRRGADRLLVMVDRGDFHSISNPCVTVTPARCSMIEAEQYLVAESSTARATLRSVRPSPASVKWMCTSVKHLRVRLGAFRGHARFALGHLGVPAPQDVYHVKRGAPADAEEHQFHRPRPGVGASQFRRSIDDDFVAAVRAGGEHRVSLPGDVCFQCRESIVVV